MNVDPQLRATVEAWIARDPDPETRGELTALLTEDDEVALRERFSGRLEFGTAGLRSAAGSGRSAKGGVTGGTYTVAFESSFGWTDGFDPTGEYLANAQVIYSSLLLRRLVGFNSLPGAAGNLPVPDLATSIPKPTNGGKTYTFHLRNGVKFGPPVNREITSKDVKYALERMARPKTGRSMRSTTR